MKRCKLFQYDENIADETTETAVLDPAIELYSYLKIQDGAVFVTTGFILRSSIIRTN